MPSRTQLGAPLVIMVGAIIAMVVFAVPAAAAPDTTPTTSVSNRHPTPGSNVTFCGSGFPAGEGIDIELAGGLDIEDEFVPFAIADASGSFCLTIPLSDWIRTGTHTITATGTVSGATSSTQIRVAGVTAKDETTNDATTNDATTKSGTTSRAELASTGSLALRTWALGGLLLICGVAMVVASGRRKVNA